ncbi:aliphatic sulfonate ABC transporter substrate-binding protein [Novimethylophilus kurashikiensis]|uniref:Aliphatic sulfonate ABC transporter substrate-binding protein n=1 Tax=Novimethylophilus kurashikiensis TaxID=1825523 RepID=A0A2R5FIX6_9PROT|nr:PhnD/SsuA/transferrin family substrate-binding protein [Novimethylophilus kurashikiensis]GBG15851.1 aliphatic sulfonate ABC transporter substrate-binding protein [Novimethylophilus kurashikiensis]
MNKPLIMGAVAYAPKVVTIWEGFKQFFEDNGLPFDFVLYSNYERQVEALFDGSLDIAWNSPLAWLRAERMGRALGKPVTSIAMRDSDRDLTSLIVVRADAKIEQVADLRGKTVAVGAVDSPQATLLPLYHLYQQGLKAGTDFTVQRHDLLGGKHGDHIGGERDAARALLAGQADAACMIAGNHLLFTSEGTLPAGSTRILTQTPLFDHCNFTVAADAPAKLVARMRELLLGMSWDDPALRPLLELEGLKQWMPERTEGYRDLDAAVDVFGFYDKEGRITCADYRY